MEQGTYKDLEIEYRGFKIDNAYLFSIIETGKTIYLSNTQIKNISWKK
tara:strand:+ start:1557 stop:1700 length:144 start_codon:yes stop_codon:yes gene_type:complete